MPGCTLLCIPVGGDSVRWGSRLLVFAGYVRISVGPWLRRRTGREALYLVCGCLGAGLGLGIGIFFGWWSSWVVCSSFGWPLDGAGAGNPGGWNPGLADLLFGGVCRHFCLFGHKSAAVCIWFLNVPGSTRAFWGNSGTCSLAGVLEAVAFNVTFLG